jgi:uncharacterized RDD family membrane protein YckC
VAEIVTGEAVVLELPCARFPSRAVALLIDLMIQGFLIIVLLVVVGAGSGRLDAAALAAIGLTTLVVIIVGYPVVWETTTRGRSPGKFALGLRVVGDDGSPEQFRQALVRGLATIIDFWLFFFLPAIICSALSEKGKRLGDVFAGTFVIQQRLPTRRYLTVTPSLMPPELAAWAARLELSGLTDQTAAMTRGYLGRLAQLTPGARDELGQRIATAVSGQVSPPPPPGTPVLAYLSAVLAERNRREHARLAGAAGHAPVAWGAQQAATAPPGWTTAPPGWAPGPATWAGQPPTAPPWPPPPWPPPAAPPPTVATPAAHPATAPAALAPTAPPPAPPAGQPPAGEPPSHSPALPASQAGPGTEWKTAAREGEEKEPDLPGQSADPPAAARGGFVPPQ